MAFHVGQKVVCVNDSVNDFVKPGFNYTNSLTGLKKGKVYTIRGIVAEGFGPYADGSVYLSEIIRPLAPGFERESPYHPRRFVPLQEQGMSILRAILADPKVKIKETA